jgi:hypothetical protein
LHYIVDWLVDSWAYSSPDHATILIDVTFLLTFLEFLVAKLSALVVTFLMVVMAGVARAAEIPDAPIPEPNYLGIIIFFALFLGLGIWFVWKVMSKKEGDDKR